LEKLNMEKYKPHIGDKIVGFIFKDKIHIAISYIVWSFIYKIIDMNTIQWFGKGIFVTKGEPWEFLVMSVLAFFILSWIVMGIFSFLTGKS
tara:strand:+ start:434 stop:706 length:273 start_codon:yes stop_codon:yes gene_type:complete